MAKCVFVTTTEEHFGKYFSMCAGVDIGRNILGQKNICGSGKLLFIKQAAAINDNRAAIEKIVAMESQCDVYIAAHAGNVLRAGDTTCVVCDFAHEPGDMVFDSIRNVLAASLADVPAKYETLCEIIKNRPAIKALIRLKHEAAKLFLPVDMDIQAMLLSPQNAETYFKTVPKDSLVVKLDKLMVVVSAYASALNAVEIDEELATASAMTTNKGKDSQAAIRVFANSWDTMLRDGRYDPKKANLKLTSGEIETFHDWFKRLMGILDRIDCDTKS